MQSDLKKMLKKNEQLNQLDMATVVSHIQREGDEWIYNTIMLEGYDVPFKYLRKKAYKNLKGARVNVTYYPETEQVAGMEFEIMKLCVLSVPRKLSHSRAKTIRANALAAPSKARP